MIKKNKVEGAKYVKIMSIISLIVSLSIILWLIYSFYVMYHKLNQPVQNVAYESYIDKAGLEQVKYKLGERK